MCFCFFKYIKIYAFYHFPLRSRLVLPRPPVHPVVPVGPDARVAPDVLVGPDARVGHVAPFGLVPPVVPVAPGGQVDHRTGWGSGIGTDAEGGESQRDSSQRAFSSRLPRRPAPPFAPVVWTSSMRAHGTCSLDAGSGDCKRKIFFRNTGQHSKSGKFYG